MNLSRHNLSRAGTLLQGSAAYATYQGGKAGVEMTYTYLWRPTNPAFAQAFTAGLAAGVGSGTLTGNWLAPTGFYSMTFSTGQVVLAWLTQSSTAVTFYNPLPLNGGAPIAAVTQAAVTANVTVAGVPPALGVANAYAASQSIGAAANAVLNGAQVGSYTNQGTVYNPAGIPDVPRNVVGAWTTSSTITVKGFDQYGVATSEVQTGTSFTGKKAFAVITSITSSASITAATFGNAAVLGLPFACSTGNWFGALLADASDAGTFVQADFTSPATTSTGDPRGTYAAAGALNGVKFLNSELRVFD